jgi:hypothetical protein
MGYFSSISIPNESEKNKKNEVKELKSPKQIKLTQKIQILPGMAKRNEARSKIEQQIMQISSIELPDEETHINTERRHVSRIKNRD